MFTSQFKNKTNRCGCAKHYNDIKPLDDVMYNHALTSGRTSGRTSLRESGSGMSERTGGLRGSGGGMSERTGGLRGSGGGMLRLLWPQALIMLKSVELASARDSGRQP